MSKLHISPDLASALADSTPDVVAEIERAIRETLERAEPAISRYFTTFPADLDYDPVSPFSGGALFAWLQSLLFDVVAFAPQYVEETLYVTLKHSYLLPERIRTPYRGLVVDIFSRNLRERNRAIVLDLILSVTNDEKLHSSAVVDISMAFITSLTRTLYRAPTPPKEDSSPFEIEA